MEIFTVNSKDLFDRTKNPGLSLSPREILKNERIPKQMRVRQMTSERSGRAVANQFIISTYDATYFQSYHTIIVMRKGGKVYLDKDAWDYSVTTGKYRNQFLGETKKETERKIKSGEYILADLN